MPSPGERNAVPEESRRARARFGGRTKFIDDWAVPADKQQRRIEAVRRPDYWVIGKSKIEGGDTNVHVIPSKALQGADCSGLCGTMRGDATMRGHDAGVAQLVEHQPSKLKTQLASPAKTSTSESGSATPSSSPSSGAQNTSTADHDLAAVIDAWPALPEVVKARIAGMAEAVRLNRP